MDVNSSSPFFSKPPSIYTNSNTTSDLNNARQRQMKANIPIQTTGTQPAHFVLNAGDFLLHEKEQEKQHFSTNKHRKKHILLLILMALLSLVQNLRSNIPEDMGKSEEFWSMIKPLPISRVDTINLRPNATIEKFLFQLAEISQTIWLTYILSFIPRRTHLGYLYRNPDLFNVLFCSLLISTISLQIISQTPVLSEISCGCLLLGSILLIVSCRLIVMKFAKYEEKLKRIDVLIIRYFVLNSLFLYTTSIVYLTICSAIEYFAFHFDPTANSISTTTSIGFVLFGILLIIYHVLERWIYKEECRSVWTPYLFFAVVFHCPPLRKYFPKEKIFATDDRNYYLLWGLSSTIIVLILIRIGQQLFLRYRQNQRRMRRLSFTREKSLETKNE